MSAIIIIIIIVWISMWGFYKFMYPRAPRSMMPKEGDVTTLRDCNFCGHSLAEYRGVVETKPTVATDTTLDGNNENSNDANNNASKELFFCNYEHQADFHAGKKYS